MTSEFWIDVALAVLLRLVKDGHVPSKYLAGLTKLRDGLNLLLPPEAPKDAEPNPDPGGGQTDGPGK